MADKSKKSEAKKPKPAILVNRFNYPVTVEYDGKSIVISPKQSVRVPDSSKIGKATADIVVRIV